VRILPNTKYLIAGAGALMALLFVMQPTAAAADAPMFREVTNSHLPTTGKSFGAVWADIDQDGRLDFLLGHHGHGVSVYLNRSGLNLARQDSCAYVPCQDIDQHGVAACDYDGDGDWDLYVTVGADRGQGTGPNQMWTRGAGGQYTNLLPAKHALADVRGRGRGAVWVRLDNDRYPELLVLNYHTPARLFAYNGQSWQNKSQQVNPYLAPDNPRRDFKESRGLWMSAAGVGDLDGDRHTDLVLAGDGHFLFHNDGQGGLVDVTAAAGLPQKVRNLIDIVLGDVDNDGDLDTLYLFRHLGGIRIWLNESTPGRMRFSAGPSLTHLPLAAELESALLADFDNDGILDLQVMMMDQESNNRPNLLARGMGDGNFVDVTSTWGARADVAALPCGAWPLDLDRDGDLDLMQIHGKEDFPERDGVCVLHENTTTNPGLTLELATGPFAPHGMGAKVELRTTAGVQTRQVRSVLHHWNATIAPLHFGLGTDPGPYAIVVTWPDGRRQELTLPHGRAAYFLRQGEYAAVLTDE
jgi:hypothetical protein